MGRRLLVVTLIVALVLPVAALLTVIAAQAVEGFRWLQEALTSQGIAGLVDRLPRWLERLARQSSPRCPSCWASWSSRSAPAAGGR